MWLHKVGDPEHRILWQVELVTVVGVGANVTAAICEIDQRAGRDVMVVAPVEDWIERRAATAVHGQCDLITPVLLIGVSNGAVTVDNVNLDRVDVSDDVVDVIGDVSKL